MFAAFAVMEDRFDRNDGHFLTSHISKNSVFLLSKKLTLVQERVAKQIICRSTKPVIRIFRSGVDSTTPADNDVEVVRLTATRNRAMDEAGAVIARQLNGLLTALLLYMGEIKLHSHREAAAYWITRLKRVMTIENALRGVRSVDRLPQPPRPGSRAAQ
jgi:hypothetical protein